MSMCMCAHFRVHVHVHVDGHAHALALAFAFAGAAREARACLDALASQMAMALEFSGWEYRLEVGDGTHRGIHGSSILPEVLQWMWRDWRSAESQWPEPEGRGACPYGCGCQITNDDHPGRCCWVCEFHSIRWLPQAGAAPAIIGDWHTA